MAEGDGSLPLMWHSRPTSGCPARVSGHGRHAYSGGMDEAEKLRLLERYAQATISAMEVRRALGGITFGDLLVELAKRDLSLPRASRAGREERIAEARALLFPPAA
jgi:hypothetical protein